MPTQTYTHRISVVVVRELGMPIKAPDVESVVTDKAGEERSREVGEGEGDKERDRGNN